MNANGKFLSSITPQTKAMIIDSIAARYGTTAEAIIEEVCGPEAESLLDYMVGPDRWRVWVEHHKTGERIYESEAEKAHKAHQAA